MRIEERIKQHSNVYRNAGIPDNDIPPFRITPEEHKELFNFVNIVNILMGDHGKSKKGEIISYYYGVKLELVVIVGEYC